MEPKVGDTSNHSIGPEAPNLGSATRYPDAKLLTQTDSLTNKGCGHAFVDDNREHRNDTIASFTDLTHIFTCNAKPVAEFHCAGQKIDHDKSATEAIIDGLTSLQEVPKEVVKTSTSYPLSPLDEKTITEDNE